MIQIVIKPEDISKVNKMLNELDVKKRNGAIEKGLKKSCSSVLERLVANVSGVILKRRTGNLAKSMGWRIDKVNEIPEGIIGSGASLNINRMVYANIHETGGVITPKRAKMLAIPIGRALTRAGVARFKPREITSAGYDNSFIRRTNSGNLILFGTKGSKLIPLFVLKDSVKIPARRYMSITAEETQTKVVDDIVGEIKKVKENQ
jgi:phage gpG-like protein